tara:strand:+ start:152 stop:352 length:201 start_codon:yes stop_codon:yes gene_type:complete
MSEKTREELMSEKENLLRELADSCRDYVELQAAYHKLLMSRNILQKKNEALQEQLARIDQRGSHNE